MNHSDCRIVEREVVTVDAASQVDVLRIHKEAFIEQRRTYLGIGSQQHKAATQVRHIERADGIGGMQLVAGIATAHPRIGQEAATENIKRRRQQFAEMLRDSFGIGDTRHELTHHRIGLHKIAQRIDIRRTQAYITIQHQMQRNRLADTATNSDIMRTAIAQISPCKLIRHRCLRTYDRNAISLEFIGTIALGIVDKKDMIEMANPDQFVQQRPHLTLPIGVVQDQRYV